ncbi:MAG: DUF2953 domain-containing protein [Clostridia bacterium]|nr:DUF2953 domain-containing protein [Clostridia bacterium]
MAGCLLTVFFILLYILTFILLSRLNIKIYGELSGADFTGYIDFRIYGLKLFTLRIGDKKQKNKKKKPSIFKNREKVCKRLKNYRVSNIEANVKIGLEDAAVTAVSVGVVYSLLSTAYAVLANYIRIDKINFDVKPIFSGSCFELNFLCIIDVKVVNIIIDVLHVWLSFFREKVTDNISHMRRFEEHKILKGRV